MTSSSTAFAARNFDFAAAKSAEIVALYNDLVLEVGPTVAPGVKPVARFADRATAVARTSALLEKRNELAARLAEVVAPAVVADAKAATRYVVGTCPACGSSSNITCGRVINRNRVQVVVDEQNAFCHDCEFEFNYDTGAALRRRAAPKDPAGRAAAIAASWTNPATLAARTARHSVTFTDSSGAARSFRSVREAFEALSLPLGRHIAFRAKLKAAGTLEAFGGVWVAVAA